jgi:hypothetical protein
MDLSGADRAIAAFDEYYRLQDKRTGGKFNDIGIEARRRIEQCRRLLQLAIAAQSSAHADLQVAMAPAPTDPNSDYAKWVEGPEYRAWQQSLQTDSVRASVARSILTQTDLELYSESFYWIAFRARHALRAMPGFGSFEAEGVRDVRNKLLEHPEEKGSGVLWGGFAWGATQGPVIKAVRYENQAQIFPDAGLYVNADQFFSNIEHAANNAVQNASGIKWI